jgi:hypothetical protein
MFTIKAIPNWFRSGVNSHNNLVISIEKALPKWVVFLSVQLGVLTYTGRKARPHN